MLRNTVGAKTKTTFHAVGPPVMQQAELIRTSLLVLEPNAAWYEDMLMAAGTTFR